MKKELIDAVQHNPSMLVKISVILSLAVIISSGLQSVAYLFSSPPPRLFMVTSPLNGIVRVYSDQQTIEWEFDNVPAAVREIIIGGLYIHDHSGTALLEAPLREHVVHARFVGGQNVERKMIEIKV